jgi:hypothetical protein
MRKMMAHEMYIYIPRERESQRGSKMIKRESKVGQSTPSGDDHHHHHVRLRAFVEMGKSQRRPSMRNPALSRRGTHAVS